jgi:hypothetical protein
MHGFYCSALHLFHEWIYGLTALLQVGRMMMNIRGLVLDDPGHTMHLRALQFNGNLIPDSEIEEVAGS